MHYPVPVNGTGQSASPFWLPLPATEAARLLGKGGGKRFPSFLCLSSVYSVHSERLIRHVVLEQHRLPSQMAAADIALPITVLWGHLTNHNTTARKLFFPAAVAYGGRYIRAARDSARKLCSSSARARGRIFQAKSRQIRAAHGVPRFFKARARTGATRLLASASSSARRSDALSAGRRITR